MIISRTLLFAIILFIIPLSKAQVGFSDWEMSYFKKNSTSAQKEFIDKVEFSRDISFPKMKPKKFGFDDTHCWNIYLKKCFAAFFTESKSYAFNKAATLVYGLFSLGNYDTYSFQSQIKSSLNDTLWAENVYASLIPAFTESWKLLDQDTRRIYTEIIKYTEKYLKKFNYQAELQYLKQVKEESKLESFTMYSCNSSNVNEYRKAEAFVFRRINDAKSGNGNWTINWMNKMIKKLKIQLGVV